MIHLNDGKVVSRPAMAVERSSHASVFNGTEVFVAGGISKNVTHSSMEKYERNLLLS